MAERLTPERSVRLLRAKAGELEHLTTSMIDTIPDVEWGDLHRATAYAFADIALIATLLADHIEDLISDGDLPGGTS